MIYLQGKVEIMGYFMNYVVLDMEWNQPSFADKVMCANGVCMKNEIVQIGAVKLDENCNKVDTYSTVIKPQNFKSMNRIISNLTGLTDKDLENGISFEEAMNEFSQWCGNDYVFLIWGYDDIRILKNNLTFYGLDKSWLAQSYNLQMIFCAQNNLEKRQYALSFALEFLNIQTNAEFHDALNDAEYTALIVSKLDLQKGILQLKNAPLEGTAKEGRNELIKRKFKHIRRKEDIWANGFIVRPVCPYCSEKMKFKKPSQVGVFRYNIEGKCENHGDFMVVVRMSKTPEETYSVSQQIFVLDDKTREYFKAKQKSRRPVFRRAKKAHSDNEALRKEADVL